MVIIHRVLASIPVMLLAATPVAMADNEGWFGLGVKVDGKGRFWNPVVETIAVESIDAGSPAAASRIAVGDRIVEVDGEPVAGQRARALAPRFDKPAGGTLRLGLVDTDGTRYELVLTAASAP